VCAVAVWTNAPVCLSVSDKFERRRFCVQGEDGAGESLAEEDSAPQSAPDAEAIKEAAKELQEEVISAAKAHIAAQEDKLCKVSASCPPTARNAF